LCIICLKLYIRELHVQFDIINDLTCPKKGWQFPFLHFFIFFNILLSSNPVNAFDLVVVLDFFLLHLQAYKFTLQRNIADMMSIGHVYHYCISCGQIQVIHIPEKLFSSPFEPHLYNIKNIDSWQVHIRQPVKDIHFVAPARVTGSIIITTGYLAIGSYGTARFTSHAFKFILLMLLILWESSKRKVTFPLE